MSIVWVTDCVVSESVVDCGLVWQRGLVDELPEVKILVWLDLFAKNMIVLISAPSAELSSEQRYLLDSARSKILRNLLQ